MASFTCSKCRLPISLSQELEDPSATTYNLLKSTVSTPRTVTSKRAYPVSRESVLHEALAESNATVAGTPPQPRRARIVTPQKSNPAESFVLLTQADEEHYGRRDSLSQILEKQRKLFNLLSERSEIDHPLCTECTDSMIALMNKQMTELERERKAYISYLHKVKTDVPTEEEHHRAEVELLDLQKQEAEALEELRSVEKEHREVLAELAQLEKEHAQLDKEEQDLWHERNKAAAELEAQRDERDSITLRYDHDAKHLERLLKTNVYNDTFHIGHDGNFGTINGLRLGRLPNHPVSWDEINAAWGLTLLLLQTMAEKLNYTFIGYELCPMGSTSTIKKIEEAPTPRTTVYELYGSSDPNPLKLFQRNSFDKAMVAFLECLRQLGDHAESESVQMPYKISKDKISDACVRTAFNQDDGWTKALKFCLTNCKWILAVVAKRKG